MQAFLGVCISVTFAAVHSAKPPQTVRVTTLINPPFVDQKAGAAEGEYQGMLVDMLREMAKKLNFKYTVHVVADGKYGSRQPDGKWSGAIGELTQGKADMALLPLTVTPQRSNVIKFATPFMHSGVSMAIKRPGIDEPIPFTTFAELVEGNTNYSFGAVTHSSSARALHNFTQEQYGDCLVLNDSQFVTSAAEGLVKARAGNFAFIAADSTLNYVAASPPCDLLNLPLGFGKQTFALGLPKSAEDWISPIIAQMKDSGRLGELKASWFSGDCEKPKMCLCN